MTPQIFQKVLEGWEDQEGSVRFLDEVLADAPEGAVLLIMSGDQAAQFLSGVSAPSEESGNVPPPALTSRGR